MGAGPGSGTGFKDDAYARLALPMDALLERVNAPLRVLAVRMHPPAPGARVLDVGCGTGTQLARYVEAGCRVSGVDASPAMLARARARLGTDADLREGDATELPWPDASFDVVVCSLVLHELPAQTRGAVVREVSRVLAPGGRFVVVELAGGPVRGLRGHLTAAFIELAERAAGHRKASRTFLRSGGLLALARDTGLSVDKHRVVGGGTIELAVLAPAG